MENKQQNIKQILTLAYEHHLKNNLKLAENLYNKILKLDNKNLDALFLLGTLNLQKKIFLNAIELFNKVLKRNPNHIQGLHNLAYAYIEIGKHLDAEKLLHKVIEIQPSYVDAHYNLGNIYKFLGEPEKAELSYRKAIKLKPGNAKAYNNLGNILKDLGKFEEAINLYNKAIKIQINHANAYHNLGNTYKQLGEFEKAKKFYAQSLKYQPNNLETMWTLMELNKTIIDPNLKEKISKIMKNKNLTNKDIAYGNFLFAKHEMEQKNYKKEFDYLLKGHSHYFIWGKRKYERGISYWLKEIPQVQELMELGKSNKENEKEEIKPIFIVGVPRCGSTLIEKVIASGTKKISVGEETAIISLFVGKRVTSNQSISSNIKTIKKEIVERYKSRGLIKKENDYIFTDKSLDNFFFIGLIKEIFPSAKVINCKRNTLASMISILKNNLGDVSWAHSLEHIFKFFDLYFQQIESFKKIHPNFIYELQLENFVQNPEIESKKLMEFCNLPWDKKCLEFYKRKDLTSKTASNIQIRKAIYKDSDQKYLRYKQFLDEYGKKYKWFNH
tara:strand:+ start:167 stop:1834 length:1668 start_codon:yes stop_codon:yes gene_type:complete